MRYSTVISTLLCLILAYSSALAQVALEQDYDLALDENILTLDFSVVTPFDDFLLSVTADALPMNQDFSYCGFFTMRPFAKKFRVPARDNVYFQFREHRFILGGTLRKSYVLGHKFQGTVSGGAGYSFGDYKGTSRKPPKEWIPILGLSLLVPFDDSYIRMGYKYMQLPGSGNHHLELGFRFGD